MARHFSPRPQGLPSRAPRELAVLVQLDLYEIREDWLPGSAILTDSFGSEIPAGLTCQNGTCPTFW